MPFVPHNQTEIDAMLKTIGVDTIEDLFDEIPDHLTIDRLKGIPEGLNEMTMARTMASRAKQLTPLACYVGAGAYEHHIPAAVWDVTSRGEFLTAYTPYQAEASQGSLQLIYEFQTMMARLTAMDVSNASLYDGASALAEAVLMAVRANRKSKSKRVLLPSTVHPAYRDVVKAIVSTQNITCTFLPYGPEQGHTLLTSLTEFENDDFTALVIPQPNIFGVLEDVDALTDWAHEHNSLVIAVVNPTSLALLKPPGLWGSQGADIVCGEGQPLGIPLASGGPYMGFMCCKKPLVRQMPGRIVGRTTDQEGKTGYTLTLQAREQHIRRSKATSNICTNQGLLVTAATIYLSLMGPEGLHRVAEHSHLNLHALVKKLTTIGGVSTVFQRPVFHEAVLRLNQPVKPVLHALAKRGILGGYDLSQAYPELGHALLVCATETKSEVDLDQYQHHLTEVLAELTHSTNTTEHAPQTSTKNPSDDELKMETA